MSFLKPRRELTARQTSPAVRFNTCGGYLRDPTGHLCPNHKLRRFWTSKRMLILLRSSIWIRGYCPYAWGPYWSDKQNTMWRYEKARKLCYKRPHAVVVRQSCAGLDHQTNDRFKLYRLLMLSNARNGSGQYEKGASLLYCFPIICTMADIFYLACT